MAIIKTTDRSSITDHLSCKYATVVEGGKPRRWYNPFACERHVFTGLGKRDACVRNDG